MDNSGTQDAIHPNPQKELANDVALLYSWAKLENAPYRDFSRQRRSLSTAGENAGEKYADTAVSDGLNMTMTSPVPRSSVTREVSTGSIANGAGSQRVHETDQAIQIQAMQGREQNKSAFLVHKSPDPSRVAPPGMHEAEPLGKVPIVVAIYSIAGGVGKTSICANLAKTLCSLGEQLLLVDATSRGLLPFYFGATDLREGPRKFLAPGPNAPSLHVIASEEITTEWLDRDVKYLMASSQRTLVDLGQLSEALLYEILRMCSVVLIPLLPDFNSMATVQGIESLLHAKRMGPNPPNVFYLFNRFDENRMNDQRARDFVQQHCGHRLLPFSLRHDPQLTEAPHTGLLGVADQAPGVELSHDLLELALWVRRVTPLSSPALLTGRWSEQ